jgi:hypothetical protein
MNKFINTAAFNFKTLLPVLKIYRMVFLVHAP